VYGEEADTDTGFGHDAVIPLPVKLTVPLGAGPLLGTVIVAVKTSWSLLRKPWHEVGVLPPVSVHVTVTVGTYPTVTLPEVPVPEA
jgi:hypothetical protein